jgi:nucleoside-diphosphate-sugar epimerase
MRRDGEVAGYAGKAVWVTGSTGYLGSALLQGLQATAARVECLRGDVRVAETWQPAVEDADVIFHLAGNTSVGEAARDPAASLQSTVLPLMHLTRLAAARRRRPRVVFASTASVYGFADPLPADEDAVPRPETIYDLHKWWAEQHLAWASRQELVGGVSLRLANVYGPSRSAPSAPERGVLNRMTARALRGETLSLYGGGHCVRDYVYIDDVVRAFLLSGVTPGMTGQSYNLASGQSVTLREVFALAVERVAQTGGPRSPIHEVPWPADSAAIDRRNFSARIDRLRHACGWQPAVPLTTGLDRLIGHLRSMVR